MRWVRRKESSYGIYDGKTTIGGGKAEGLCPIDTKGKKTSEPLQNPLGIE